MSTSAEWQAGYDEGYRDGENNARFDIMTMLCDLDGDPLGDQEILARIKWWVAKEQAEDT